MTCELDIWHAGSSSRYLPRTHLIQKQKQWNLS